MDTPTPIDTPIEVLTELLRFDTLIRTTNASPSSAEWDAYFAAWERARKVIEVTSAVSEERLPVTPCVCAAGVLEEGEAYHYDAANSLVHRRRGPCFVGAPDELRTVAAPSDSVTADTSHVHESCSCGDSPSGDPHCKQCSAPLSADTQPEAPSVPMNVCPDCNVALAPCARSLQEVEADTSPRVACPKCCAVYPADHPTTEQKEGERT